MVRWVYTFLSQNILSYIFESKSGVICSFFLINSIAMQISSNLIPVFQIYLLTCLRSKIKRFFLWLMQKQLVD